MALNLKGMLPESIKNMLQTVDCEDYEQAKEYAIKQARALMEDSKSPTQDLNEKEEETEDKKKKVTFQSEAPEEEKWEDSTKDELIAWIKKWGKWQWRQRPRSQRSKVGVPRELLLLRSLGPPAERVPEKGCRHERQGEGLEPIVAPDLGEL